MNIIQQLNINYSDTTQQVTSQKDSDTTQQVTSQKPATNRVDAGKALAAKTKMAREAQKKALIICLLLPIQF